MISGFPTPTSSEDYTYPRELLPALRERFGEIDIHKPPVMYWKGKEAEITQKLLKITKRQTEITRYLMKSMEWNLTISVYDATDIIGHYFWAYLDKGHPRYDPEMAERVRPMVEEVHTELDRGVGELTEAAGPDSLRLVISDHGFGSVYYGVYVNNWLLEKEYMHFKATPRIKAKSWAYRHGLHTYNILKVAKRLRAIRSVESAYSAKSPMLRLLKMTALSMDDIDWKRTKVYSAGNFGQLYLNIEGREPEGIVDSGAGVERLTLELLSGLRALKDPSTGRRMFDHIYTRSEIFSGEADIDSPDIVFFDEEMKYSAHRMFELGSNKLVTPHPIYSGNHKMDGILFMDGAGVRRSSDLPRTPLRLIDLAPTILHRLGRPIPGEMDGRVLLELFEEGPAERGAIGHRSRPEAEEEQDPETLKIRSGIRNLKSRVAL